LDLEILQLFLAHHYFGGYVEVRHTISFGDERCSTAGPGVGLDDVYFTIFNSILYVDKPFDIQSQRYFLSIVYHLFYNKRAEVEHRQNRMAVPTVDTRRLDVLHDTHDMHFFAVANGIYLCFLAAVEEVVDEYFVAGQVLQQAHHAFFQLFVVDDDTHTLTTQYI